ncbi:MAG TPA: macro domain-containing protein [Solirubrobacterales bacterium]|nr:macro domain-containing protein [Solirubrobacterales bacterium]
MSPSVDIREGDIFKSKAQTLVNTVNCVGVMGKGIALGFRKRFPAMHDDYVRRCERGEVRLGRPYLYRQDAGPWILNFPTKDHWRSVSKLADIATGLDYLEAHYSEWGVESIAVPPLGSGLGGLEWQVVGPALYEHLDRLAIPVELYVPFGTPHEELTPAHFQASLLEEDSREGFKQIGPDWVALLSVLQQLESLSYPPPVGRILFQKLAYFATVAGLRLGLEYSRGSYGPFSPQLKPHVTHLLNNGLIEEVRRGAMFEVKLGRTFDAAKRAFPRDLSRFRPQIDRLTDLFARMRPRDAEVAATVHFAAEELRSRGVPRPSEQEIVGAVMDWKQKRQPPLDRVAVAESVRGLNALGWLEAETSDDLVGDPEIQLLHH